MDKLAIELENERLRASWDCLPSEHLANYLAVGEEDQRINAQSILTRSLLIDALWPGRFDALIHEEMRFGVVMNWLLEQLRAGEGRLELLRKLQRGSRCEIPAVVEETTLWLRSDSCPVSDYVSEALMSANPDDPTALLYEPALDIFSHLWSSLLARLTAEPVSVLEVACGSGNEYRAIQEFGLARHISYSGFDICWKNVENARKRYPDANFFEASVLCSELPDNSYDYVFVHDMIGHLSPDAMEVAVKEIMRIARKEAWIHCFNVADISQHEIRPVELYHRNRLSLSQLSASLKKAGAVSVEAFLISSMLQHKFQITQQYSASAGCFIARKLD